MIVQHAMLFWGHSCSQLLPNSCRLKSCCTRKAQLNYKHKSKPLGRDRTNHRSLHSHPDNPGTRTGSLPQGYHLDTLGRHRSRLLVHRNKIRRRNDSRLLPCREDNWHSCHLTRPFLSNKLCKSRRQHLALPREGNGCRRQQFQQIHRNMERKPILLSLVGHHQGMVSRSHWYQTCLLDMEHIR